MMWWRGEGGASYPFDIYERKRPIKNKMKYEDNFHTCVAAEKNMSLKQDKIST